jgi:hypothetical protein
VGLAVSALVCQRWREHRSSYRPAGEPIRTADYEVAELSKPEARAFVERHHYSGSFPASRKHGRFGLYRRGGELVGVAVLSVSQSQAAIDKALPLPCPREARAELGRLVLLDDVPANGESWFMARVFELAQGNGFEAIVSYSDPEQRRSIAGELVFPGHIGTVYQALNARYTGKSNPQTLRLFDDGTVFPGKTWSKLRKRAVGWERTVERLIARGAPEPSGPWLEWVLSAVRAVTREQRHHGNHRYVWALDRCLRRHLPAGQPYPKTIHPRQIAEVK